MAAPLSTPQCKHLVLDAGPLLSLSPIRGLAETYYTVPQVLEELRDPRARQHFEQLGLSAGVKVEVRAPDAASLAEVIAWAKKTGDYSVLSQADLCVIALTYALHQEEKKKAANAASEAQQEPAPEEQNTPEASEPTASSGSTAQDDEQHDPPSPSPEPSLPSDDERDESDPREPTNPDDAAETLEDTEPLDITLERVIDDTPELPQISAPTTSHSNAPIYENPSDEDDDEGEWITPSNVGLHKSRALDLLPTSEQEPQTDEKVAAGCMTADFAMQNVILQMGLSLVGVEGKRIARVKSWVLRCHACFKICKDQSKKFCPSCGNPTLLRASVTVSAPDAASDAPAMEVHLKPNFQYRLRGTKYSIPAPKPGSAKTGSREGLILREDQAEYMRAKKRADTKREREEQRMLKGILNRGADGAAAVGSWMDPDWVPEMITVGAGGKGRTSRKDNDMPTIGYGRKNPNERRRSRK
ncbi:Nin one binding Zn-ribbon like-domain-containing protein [Schizophyllum amplum]|uniref:20S-pre-rRNA D-site endonuclease NOB1 n=1 Tax=Schizophyllum amplum TaxID=97359 RepID=A0A550CTR7_9AGAR|nr:Nin one binding Zn-ribbon like-domain-containing protein [Auriculariopsis ampla]